MVGGVQDFISHSWTGIKGLPGLGGSLSLSSGGQGEFLDQIGFVCFSTSFNCNLGKINMVLMGFNMNQVAGQPKFIATQDGGVSLFSGLLCSIDEENLP